MKGWFDAFRDDGAPTLYSFSNRTPVTGDVSIVAVCVLFATIYLAFLVIFPGVRKQWEFLNYICITHTSSGDEDECIRSFGRKLKESPGFEREPDQKEREGIPVLHSAPGGHIVPRTHRVAQTSEVKPHQDNEDEVKVFRFRIVQLVQLRQVKTLYEGQT
ncbi:hypothetical protein RP20_CCG014206 [Aedes albopictus]|nr:hypothetical protein RP20_CCG014206 [Aedes albopictus]